MKELMCNQRDCGQVFISDSALYGHMADHFDYRCHECTDCYFYHWSAEEMGRHAMETHHSVNLYSRHRFNRAKEEKLMVALLFIRNEIGGSGKQGGASTPGGTAVNDEWHKQMPLWDVPDGLNIEAIVRRLCKRGVKFLLVIELIANLSDAIEKVLAGGVKRGLQEQQTSALEEALTALFSLVRDADWRDSEACGANSTEELFHTLFNMAALVSDLSKFATEKSGECPTHGKLRVDSIGISLSQLAAAIFELKQKNRGAPSSNAEGALEQAETYRALVTNHHLSVNAIAYFGICVSPNASGKLVAAVRSKYERGIKPPGNTPVAGHTRAHDELSSLRLSLTQLQLDAE